MRPDCLDRLIHSIFYQYPDAEILVANDSGETLNRNGVRVFDLPFDIGLSYGRNYLVDRAETDYLVLMDDDIVFDARTTIEKLLQPLEDGVFDLVGGIVCQDNELFPWEGLMNLDGSTLTLAPGNRGVVNGIEKVDFCHNFFAATTAVVQRVRWDEHFKLGEHTDFFLRAKANNVRVGVCPDVHVLHKPERTEVYQTFRDREKSYRLDMMKKHGLRKIINHLFPHGSLDLDAQ